MEQQKKGIRDALEILEYISGICREKEIKYTLLYTSLLAAEEDVLPDWFNIVQIGLLYDDYRILMKELADNEGTFYTVTYEKENNFREFFGRVYKRSGITLPEGREKEQRFYDNFINVFPMYEVADTEKEYNKVVKEYNYYLRCIRARAKLEGLPFKITRTIRNIKNKKYLEARTATIVKEANEYLHSIHKSGAKYVFIPGGKKLEGANREVELYKQIGECNFCGVRALKIKNSAEWIEGYWTKEQLEDIRTGTRNIVLQQGTE